MIQQLGVVRCRQITMTLGSLAAAGSHRFLDRSGQVEARFANMPPCLIGMEACVGAHHLSRKLKALGHDARLMPAKYVRPYSKGQKNDFRDAEAMVMRLGGGKLQIQPCPQCPVSDGEAAVVMPGTTLTGFSGADH